MPLKIPEDIKAAVRRDWLNGKPRDTIARDNSLSTGSVSSIISELRNGLTRTDADALRELGIMLTKSGISASECALGFRLASIIKEMGVDEDNFGHFISQIYNKCKEFGLQPEHIANNIKQLLELAGSIALSEIPEYIQEKTSEKRKLEGDIEKLEGDIEKLEGDIEKLEGKQWDARTTLALALNKNNAYLTQLEHFSNLKVELNRFGIPVEDIQRTVKIIQGVAAVLNN